MAEWRYRIELAETWKAPRFAGDFAAQRDAIVEIVMRSNWYINYQHDLFEVVEDLANAATVEEFDRTWSRLYDYADITRCWINLW